MGQYLAIAKRTPDSSAVKIGFEAINTTTAIMEMVRALGCRSTAEIAEYDLLEVIGKDQYRACAAKMGKDKYPVTGVVLNKEEKEVTPKVADVVLAETTYKPYTVKILD